jgi:hypothetical protein
MFSSKMVTFSKNEDCPSSNDLLEYQSGELVKSRISEITRHIAKCEFCAAEVEFYSHYPQEEVVESPAHVQIPAPLFELAEALLSQRHADSSSLDSLVKKRSRRRR